MFLPLGWLAARSSCRSRAPLRLLAVLPSLALGAAGRSRSNSGSLLPQRTVSVNDIVAEVIGAFLAPGCGAFGAHSSAGGARCCAWPGNRQRGARRLSPRYLVLSLSPFDFVISADELADKLASNLQGWWLAPWAAGGRLAVQSFCRGARGATRRLWLRCAGAGAGLARAAGVLGVGLGRRSNWRSSCSSAAPRKAPPCGAGGGVAPVLALHRARPDPGHRLGAVGRPLVCRGVLWLAVVATSAVGWRALAGP